MLWMKKTFGVDDVVIFGIDGAQGRVGEHGSSLQAEMSKAPAKRIDGAFGLFFAVCGEKKGSLQKTGRNEIAGSYAEGTDGKRVGRMCGLDEGIGCMEKLFSGIGGIFERGLALEG